MKNTVKTLRLSASLLVILAAVMALALVFDVISTEDFKTGFGKGALTVVILAAAFLAVVALGSTSKND